LRRSDRGRKPRSRRWTRLIAAPVWPHRDGKKMRQKTSMRKQLNGFDASVFLIPSQRGRASADASEIACEESIDRDRPRKLAIVDAPIVLDRCRSMVKAARGDPTRSGGTSDGKTSAVRRAG
jgi:hypothetical protein